MTPQARNSRQWVVHDSFFASVMFKKCVEDHRGTKESEGAAFLNASITQDHMRPDQKIGSPFSHLPNGTPSRQCVQLGEHCGDPTDTACPGARVLPQRRRLGTLSKLDVGRMTAWECTSRGISRSWYASPFARVDIIDEMHGESAGSSAGLVGAWYVSARRQ